MGNKESKRISFGLELSWAINIPPSLIFFLSLFSQASLKLKEGANSVTFSVTTKYQVQRALHRDSTY